MVYTGKIFTPKLIYIVGQLFCVSAPFGEGNDTAALHTAAVYLLRQFFPDGIFSSSRGLGNADHLDLYRFRHMGRNHMCRFGRQIIGCRLQRFYGGGQANPLQRRFTETVQSGGRQHQVGASFCVNESMEFVDDQCPGCLKNRPPGPAGQHQIQGFRCDDEDMGRVFYHALPFLLGCVPGPDAHVDPAGALAARKSADAVQGSV